MTRHIMVTGASAGIGRALVGEAVRRGHHVWGVARRTTELAALQRELGAGQFYYSHCDVTRPEDVSAVMQHMRARAFLPDVVVLNAGINAHDLVPQYDSRQYAQIMQTNLFGALAWVEQWLPVFCQRGSGHFMAISSLSAYLAHERGAAYGASKAALTSTFLSLRKRYRREGVAFTTVHLGPVDTAMWNGNRFPLLLSPVCVARRLLQAMERQSAVVDLPWLLVCLARLMQWFPMVALPSARSTSARRHTTQHERSN